MIISKENIRTGLVVVIALILLCNLFGIFKGKETLPDHFKELIAAKDETIISISRERDTYRQWKDEQTAELQVKDSILVSAFQKNQSTYKPIYEDLKNIPLRIVRISGNDDSIRAAFSK